MVLYMMNSRHRQSISLIVRYLTKYSKTSITVLCIIGLVSCYFSIYMSMLIPTPSKWTHTTVQDNNNHQMMLPPPEKKTYTPCLRDHRQWKVFTEEKINLIRTRWRTYIETVDEYPENRFRGRGIVTSTRKSVFPRFIASVLLLRWVNCTLPIEVFVFPNELTDMQLIDLRNIDHVSVYIVNETQSIHDRSTSRYAIKLYAIIECSFEHVLWLDADNIVVRDPEYLFDLPHYTKFTAIFWPDFWMSARNNPIWYILDLNCRREDYEQESGQIVINKRLTWRALHLSKHLSGDADVMKLLVGDKDTFRFSWLLMNNTFYFIRKYLAIAGFYQRGINDTGASEFCGHTMVQHDPLGEILFLHANMIKYHPNIQYLPEPKYPQIMNMSNPWRVFRRYANTASYLKASIYRKYGYSCTTFPTDGPPLYEEEFHNLISPNITMMYLLFLRNYTSTILTSHYASIVE